MKATITNVRKKIKRHSNGFTLIEVIVVLLILAILAGLVVPALTGFIDDSGKRTKILECRSCVLASSKIVVDYHAEGKALHNVVDVSDPFNTEVLTLAEVPKDGVINRIYFTNSAVSELYYTRDGVTVKYANKRYTFVSSIGDQGGSGGGGTGDSDSDSTTVNFTDASKVDGTERLEAIVANANALIGLFNIAMPKALNAVSPDTEIKYWNKDRCTANVMPGCLLCDKDYSIVLSAQSVSIDEYLKPLLVQNGIPADASITFMFDKVGTVKGSTSSLWDTRPSRVIFKSVLLTGDKSQYYTYFLKSGELKADEIKT